MYEKLSKKGGGSRPDRMPAMLVEAREEKRNEGSN